MTNYFARVWNRTWSAPGIGEGDPIMISSHAKVSLGQKGAVFLHTRSGVVFTSNHVGARIWQGLRDHESVETIVSRISREDGVEHAQVRRDTAKFVAELETHEFLSRRIGA
jgi:Coenzyme PQQ synthesis protein D (PqqD)